MEKFKFFPSTKTIPMNQFIQVSSQNYNEPLKCPQHIFQNGEINEILEKYFGRERREKKNPEETLKQIDVSRILRYVIESVKSMMEWTPRVGKTSGTS